MICLSTFFSSCVACMHCVCGAYRYMPQLNTLKQLRILRVLRPLRVISRIEGMKVVLNTLNEVSKRYMHASRTRIAPARNHSTER